MISSKTKPRFLKPGDNNNTFEEDKSDVDLNQATTFVYNPHLSLALEQQRKRLPIFSNRNHILYLLENYQTLVLVGETGCGKSTQVPQYLLEAGWASDGKVIGITEPRRVAATTLAARVADEKGEFLGQQVGYSIRFDDRFHPHETKIKYMTEGILLREMMADPLLRNYSVIMLDEVHERTLNTDIVMGLLKKILRKQRSLKLIVASATVDAAHLRDFFNLPSKGRDSACALSVEGRLYPVQVHYLQEPAPDYVQAVVQAAVKIHAGEPPGDVLAFLTGQEEVDRAVSLLREHADGLARDKAQLLVLPMYGSLPNSDQLKVFRPPPKNCRKVIVATNIAETSITVPGIVYVVDCGFVKMRRFNADTRTDSLVVVPVSQASAEQRSGRAGRVGPGKAYRLYRESDHRALPVATPPEMLRSDLAGAVLQLKALGIDNVLRFNFPSPPPARNLLSALELLSALGALDGEGRLARPRGATMAEFPMGPMFSRALMASGEFGCSEEMLSILSMLQVQTVFARPTGGQAAVKARVARRRFEVEEGDLATLLNVYTAFASRGASGRDWCRDNFLHYKGLQRAQEIRKQMAGLLRRFDVPLVSCQGDVTAVRRSIVAGFFPNAAYLHYTGVYRLMRGDQDLHIHPSSVLYTLEQPQWVVFCELVYTNKAYMRDLTTINPDWLEEQAPHFYKKVTEQD